MGTNDERNIFRLAAVLYADDNYTISQIQLHKKILENALFELNSSDWVSATTVANFICNTYSLIFTEEEIIKLVTNPKFADKVFQSYSEGEEFFIALSAMRIETLSRRIEEPTIFTYVEEFALLNHLNQEDTKEIITHFLHSVFTQNVENFRRLLNSPISLLSVSTLSTISDSDKITINDFLNWENENKNKAIFRIASYALEYCMLTNTANTSLDLDSLRNKRFYLDTNIIYRALGINGELRMSRTRSLLNKFRTTKEALYISKVTEMEFENSICYYIDKIRKFENPGICAKAFLEQTIGNTDFYGYYQKWRLKRINTSLDLFKAQIMADYDAFKQSFNITVDAFAPCDFEGNYIKQKLENYANEIRSCKPKVFEGKIIHDAKNILWIEGLTAKNPQNIYEAKAFLLSSDHKLQMWDYGREKKVPTIFLPSQWLSISLRFLERTNDDYASFVSFLNLPINDRLLDNEQIYAILSGISEYTSDYTQQNSLFQKFISIKTESALAQQKSDTLQSESRIFAKSELEIELENRQKTIEKVEAKLLAEKKARIETESDNRAKQKSLTDDIATLSTQLEAQSVTIETQDKTISDLSHENKKLKDFKHKTTTITKIVIWGVLLLGLLLILLLCFFFHSWEYNFVHIVLDWLNNFGETERNIGVTLVCPVYGYLFYHVFKELKQNYKLL